MSALDSSTKERPWAWYCRLCGAGDNAREAVLRDAEADYHLDHCPVVRGPRLTNTGRAEHGHPDAHLELPMTYPQPFSNSDMGASWQADHCDVCQRDALFRNGVGSGCPILARALVGGAPPEWVLPDPVAGGQDYTCLAIRPIGTARDGGPRRWKPGRPVAPGVLPLFSLRHAGPQLTDG